MKKLILLFICICLSFTLLSFTWVNDKVSYNITVTNMDGDGSVLKADKEYIEKEISRSINGITQYWNFKYAAKPDIRVHLQDGIISKSSGTDIILRTSLVKERIAPITHELAHSLSYLDSSQSGDNAFFREGISEFMQDKYGNKSTSCLFNANTMKFEYMTLDNEMKKIKKPISLNYLINNPQVFDLAGSQGGIQSVIDRRIAYAEAGSFFKFLDKKYGKDRLRLFYRSKKSLDFKGAFKKDINQLEKEWKHYYHIK